MHGQQNIKICHLKDALFSGSNKDTEYSCRLLNVNGLFHMKFNIIQIFDIVVLKYLKFIPTALRNFPLYNTNCLTLYDT